MKKLLRILFLYSAFLILNSEFALAQDTLFSENFEFAPTAFTLNTTDVTSTSSGYNNWIVNNAYAGGNGSITCFGLPFTFSIPSTPSQPSGISSNYMHMVSSAAIASGVYNCCFLSADGLCNNAENYFTKMTNDINAQSYDSVNFSFLWLCAGGANSYGEVYYSTDGGQNWTLTTTPQTYNNQATWVQKNISLPAFAHQNTLRFGFRFVNQVATAANDPGFGIDDILVTASTFTSINDLQFTNYDLKVFPNPAKNEITIAGYALQNNQPAVLKIYDVMGKEIISQSIVNRTSQIVNLKSFTNGVYFVQLQTGAKVSCLKFVKQ